MCKLIGAEHDNAIDPAIIIGQINDAADDLTAKQRAREAGYTPNGHVERYGPDDSAAIYDCITKPEATIYVGVEPDATGAGTV